MQRLYPNPLHLVNYTPSNANAPLPTVLIPQVNLFAILIKTLFCANDILFVPHSTHNAKVLLFREGLCGGAYRIRTGDLYNANVARYRTISISSPNTRLWGLRCANWNLTLRQTESCRSTFKDIILSSIYLSLHMVYPKNQFQ